MDSLVIEDFRKLKLSEVVKTCPGQTVHKWSGGLTVALAI